MTESNVMLAFPHRGDVRTEFMKTSIGLLCGDSPVSEAIDLFTGPGIGMARDKLADRFLGSPNEWLWFLDTDMVASVNTLPALLAAADPVERPVVGALCCVLLDNQVRSSMYTASRAEDGTFAFAPLIEWPENTLLRVDATGCGCLLIHRSVFKRVSEAKPEDDGLWFSEMIIDGHQIGEDLSFCMRCAMAEIPVFVHTGIQVGHMKTIQLGKTDP